MTDDASKVPFFDGPAPVVSAPEPGDDTEERRQAAIRVEAFLRAYPVPAGSKPDDPAPPVMADPLWVFRDGGRKSVERG